VRLDGTLGQSGVPEGTMPAQIAVKVLHVPRGDGVGSPEERAPQARLRGEAAKEWLGRRVDRRNRGSHLRRQGRFVATKQRRGVCRRLCEVTGAVSQGRKRWGEEAGISV
jgi:hypothetical protein